MIIEKLNSEDKKSISSWRYKADYDGFNYALQSGGWIDSYCCKDDFKCYSAKVNGEIIGLFLFIEDQNNEFRILINPSCLSKGYGKSLVKEALHVGFNVLQYEKISLIVRKKHSVAIKLYQNFAFEIVGEKIDIVNNESMEFLKMEKLSSSHEL